jgi:glycosyltransferase involved in cell wall biosynthesis
VRHEVAIYSASSGWAGFYDRSAGWDGGAERQMMLLARTLSERGASVAHITFPAQDPVELTYDVTLVSRAPRQGHGLRRGLRELLTITRAFVTANADVLVIRSASGVLAIAALYCMFFRRKLIFSSSNVSDFTLETMSRRSARFYAFGLRRASAVVVQSEEQRTLAAEKFPRLRNVVRIPSFAQGDSPEGPFDEIPEAFLWFGRSAPYKHPLRYVELARAFPEARFRMIVTWTSEAGDLRERLDEATAGVPNLELLAAVKHPELMRLIPKSVAVVNTSSLEGMPNSFLEAWSCGTPVLTFEFDPDGVVARHNLGVSASGSWEAFIDGARQLWASRADRDEVARHVRQYLSETHSVENVGARWRSLITDVRSGREPSVAPLPTSSL